MAGWALCFYEGANNNTATGNIISDSDVGVENWTSTGNTVTGNKIYGNFCGLHNNTTPPVTATCNWWSRIIILFVPQFWEMSLFSLSYNDNLVTPVYGESTVHNIPESLL
jgi:parallel beta-helix repeat protein